MRFGILLASGKHPGLSDSEVLSHSVTMAQAAEAAGFSDVWVTEHHFLGSVVAPSSMVFASHLLGVTTRVNVGTAVTLLPLHSPVHIAEQAALLDHLGRGRFVLGVGRGLPLVEYEVFGSSLEHWNRGIGEALDVVRRAWAGSVEADSDLYRFGAVTVTPTPRSADGPPTYLAAGSADSIAAAATRGLPMLLYFDKDAPAKKEMIDRHAAIARASGHCAPAGFDHAFAVMTHVVDTEQQARAIVRNKARSSVLANNDFHSLLDRRAKPELSERQQEEAIDQISSQLLKTQAVGDVDTCAGHLAHAIRTCGATRVLCQVEAGPDHRSSLRNLDRLASEVFPQVRKQVEGAHSSRLTPR
ncbi:LLM class flavin-dependent oxidoreductase [Amycolatopsis silviterrae]|uniref:LLM class flavin-dependent oxidoreductase n=1 Tax=Amycolatopsis silviterrae TaxID=1656914 RepID=A0ABW5H951_9PSEU